MSVLLNSFKLELSDAFLIAGRSHLPAIPNSFNSIANLRRFNLTWTMDNITGFGIEGHYTVFNLKVVPDCINLLSGLRDLMLGLLLFE